MTKAWATALKGVAMGMAEVVPGVSGGTIAFISGIYETLIHSIKSFDLGLIRKIGSGQIQDAAKQIQLGFLAPLLIGMFGGIVIGVFGIHYLIEHYPVLVWAFFFGLILASAIFIARDIDRWRPKSILLLIAGALIAYIITKFSPASQSQFSYWYIFLSGAVAICALILPGISGSFILLLLGIYTFIIGSVKDILSELSMAAVIPMLIFALGCIVGLLSFSRLLSHLFKHHRTPTLAVLIGFIIGALNKIWPWQNTVSWINDDGLVVESLTGRSNEEFEPLMQTNVLPGDYTGQPMMLGAILAFVLGFFLVSLLFIKRPTS